MKEYSVGVVTKPQGLKGEFRAKINPEFYSFIKIAKSCKIKNKEYEIVKVTDRGGFFVIACKGIENAESVELNRNAEIILNLNEKLVEKNAGILNYNVMVNGVLVGIIEKIDNFGAADVLTIVNGNKEIMCAVAPKLIESVNDENKTVVFNENVFNEVKIWE